MSPGLCGEVITTNKKGGVKFNIPRWRGIIMWRSDVFEIRGVLHRRYVRAMLIQEYMYTTWATDGVMQQFRRWILSIYQFTQFWRACNVVSAESCCVCVCTWEIIWTRLTFFCSCVCFMGLPNSYWPEVFVLCSFLASLKTDGVDTECSTYITQSDLLREPRHQCGIDNITIQKSCERKTEFYPIQRVVENLRTQQHYFIDYIKTWFLL